VLRDAQLPRERRNPGDVAKPVIVPGFSEVSLRRLGNLSSGVVHERGRTWDYEVLRDFVTVERLRSYLMVSSGDLARAFRLYEWNLRASVSVLGLTSIVEVVVRNALDRELRAWSTSMRRGLTMCVLIGTALTLSEQLVTERPGSAEHPRFTAR
jgi:hypothetical protein